MTTTNHYDKPSQLRYIEWVDEFAELHTGATTQPLWDPLEESLIIDELNFYVYER